MDDETKDHMIEFIDACRKSRNCKIAKTGSGLVVVLDTKCYYVGNNGDAQMKERDFGWRYVTDRKRGHR